MRGKARETAFKIIYKNQFVESDFSAEELLEEDQIVKEEDINFINALVSLYQKNKQELNAKINEKLIGYTPDRVYRIDRAILLLALTEILYYKQTPVKVVINEAIEMAKKYSTEKSFSFVNGMLKSLTEGVNVI